MAFTPITPSSTALAQLRAALLLNIETQGNLKTITTFPAGAQVNTSATIDYQKMVDEALAALFGVLSANTSGATQTAINNFRTQAGV